MVSQVVNTSMSTSTSKGVVCVSTSKSKVCLVVSTSTSVICLLGCEYKCSVPGCEYEYEYDYGCSVSGCKCEYKRSVSIRL